MKLLLLSLALAVPTGTAFAQEFVTAKGRLSDDDFYRLVTCAAPPGGECQKSPVRWRPKDAKDLTLGTLHVTKGVPPRLRTQVEEALDHAIDKLNAAGANLHIRYAEPSETPDIKILFLGIQEGATIAGTGISALDGTVIAAATFTISWRGDRTLTDCYISVSSSVRFGDAYSIMLEELTQCMGLSTDIGGSYYETKSVFSETSNSLARLGKQDLMALRRHYP